MTSHAERLHAFAADMAGGSGGAIVAVSLPDGSTVEACAGTARADGSLELAPTTPFHVASAGKMIAALLVHQLAEEGAFGLRGLDTTLPGLASLGLLDDELAEQLHPEAGRVTVRHLLAHTSGLKDMQVDDADGTAEQYGGIAPGSIQAQYWRAVRDVRRGTGDGAFARRRWSPWRPDRPDDTDAGHLNCFLATGTAAAPIASPGERFHYSDTAYVVLGLLVEAARGVSFHQAQRTLVLDLLDMQATYLAYHDDPTPEARSTEMDVWLGDIGLLSAGFDLSFDWGGGGQVSTAGDLIRLIRGVWAGTCLRTERARGAMLDPTHPSGLAAPRVAVGSGVQYHRVGHRCVVGHGGAWGVRVFLDTATDIAVAATVGRRDDCAWLPGLFDLAESFAHLDRREPR